MLPILVSQRRSRGPGSSVTSALIKSPTYEVFASIRQYGLLCATARRIGLELASMPGDLYIRFPIADLKGLYFRISMVPDDESAVNYAPSKHKQGEETVTATLDVSDQLFEHFNARNGLIASRISFQSVPSECEFALKVKPWTSVTVELDSSKFETLESFPSVAFLRLQLSSLAFELDSSLGLRYGTGEITKVILHCEGEDDQQIGRISNSTKLTLKAPKTDSMELPTTIERRDAFLVDKAIDVEYLLLQARHKGNFPVSAILVHGPAGTGKSHLVGQVAARVGYKLVQITAADILDVRVASPFDWILRKHLQLPTDDEFADHPTDAIVDAVLFFDDIDVLLAADEVADLESQRKVLILFEQLIDSLKTILPKARNSIVVVGCSNSPGSIGPSTRKLFEREVSIDFPSANARFHFLRQLVSSSAGLNSKIEDDALREVSDSCHGFSLSDLENMLRIASTSARMRSLNIKSDASIVVPPTIADDSIVVTPSVAISSTDSALTTPDHLTIDDIKRAKSQTTAETLKSDLHLVPTPTTKVDRKVIGGLESAYQSLMQSTVWMVRYASQLARLGVSSPRGVLLFGPPGTGKTLLAKCVASEWNANFLSVSISDLVRGEVGATERQIAALFKTAKAIAPTIIFIDEIQALFSSRDSGSVGAHGKNMISQLTLELDGLTQDSMVSVIGATNRPDWIDPALLRPGRFERCLYIAPPSESARAHILKNMLSKYNLDHDSVNDATIDYLAKRTVNFSGADMANLCLKAAWNVIKESLGIAEVAVPGQTRSARTTPSKFGFGFSPSTSPLASPNFGASKPMPRHQSVGNLDTSSISTATSNSIASTSASSDKLRKDHLEAALMEMSPSMTKEMLIVYEQFQNQYGRADLQSQASEHSTLHAAPSNKSVGPPRGMEKGSERDRWLAMKRAEKH